MTAHVLFIAEDGESLHASHHPSYEQARARLTQYAVDLFLRGNSGIAWTEQAVRQDPGAFIESEHESLDVFITPIES